jgi:AcrR family transcriptional regulator
MSFATPHPNPRVQRTKTHVLSVARGLLPSLGPSGLTYSILAAETGVTRQTLYRHWPTRERLFAELVLTGPDVAYPHPSGDPRVTVTEFLTSLRAGMSDPATASALTALVAQADRDPDSASALRAIAEDRRAALNTLLTGTGRQVDSDEFARLCGPVLYRRFFAPDEISEDLILSIVDSWL